MRLRLLFSLTVSPMVLAAIAVVTLFVAPLGAMPGARADLAVALDQRDAIHEYAVTIEQDTLRALGGLSGNITMTPSTEALERWSMITRQPGIPASHATIHDEAAVAHAILADAVASGDPTTVAPAFDSALETASAGLLASNGLIDRRLSQLSSAAPAQAGLEDGIIAARQHLEMDRALAREARALGQVGVEMGVADADDTGRLTIAILEAERSADAVGPTTEPKVAEALAWATISLQEARRLSDAGALGPAALGSLWPPLQAALAALEVARDEESMALHAELHGVERRATIAGWTSGATVIALATTAPVAVWILQQRVVRPILALHRVTEGEALADPIAEAYGAQEDEVGELTRSFAKMAHRIERTNTQLTAALAEANQRREELQHSFELLAESDRLRQHILNTASHELRTPLTPMRIHLRLLAGGTQGALTEAQTRSIAALESNLTRLTNVVSSMAQLHALQQGQAPAHVSDIDIADVAQQAFDANEQLLAAAGVTLRIQTPPKVMASADAERLRQALDIVLDNARIYTPSGGMVTIAVGDGPSIDVTDTGRGMASEDMDRLFQPFERGLGQADAPGAAGLGLAIAKALMERMGGTITGHSDGPGQGSTFRLGLNGPSL